MNGRWSKARNRHRFAVLLVVCSSIFIYPANRRPPAAESTTQRGWPNSWAAARADSRCVCGRIVCRSGRKRLRSADRMEFEPDSHLERRQLTDFAWRSCRWNRSNRRSRVQFRYRSARDPYARGFDSHTLPPYLSGSLEVGKRTRRQKAAIREIDPVF
jgi:hypothetical protein